MTTITAEAVMIRAANAIPNISAVDRSFEFASCKIKPVIVLLGRENLKEKSQIFFHELNYRSWISFLSSLTLHA